MSGGPLVTTLALVPRRTYSVVAVPARSMGPTVAEYAERWHDERRDRVYSVADERTRLGYILRLIGELPIASVRPRHIRDMVRALRQQISTRGRPFAPRTIQHMFHLAHNLFASAVIDEVIALNPVVVRRNELPPNVDLDPLWRIKATYEVEEVIKLITDPRVQPRYRVLTALKALAGLRHGEAAALCWHHLHEDLAPLAGLAVVQSWNSKVIKSTKTQVARLVPVHPVLRAILRQWRACWSRFYGRTPAPADLIVPSARIAPIDKCVAQRALRRDLKRLGLRELAGALRARGGHDLRSWFMTHLAESGADALIVRPTTHAKPRDVVGGYLRFQWRAVCREVAKLEIKLPKGDPLAWPEATRPRAGRPLGSRNKRGRRG